MKFEGGSCFALFIVVLVVFSFVGFIVGIVMVLLGNRDTGGFLAYLCGLPVMAMLMSSAKSRKR